ncbi:hypothetical protein SLEP1_g59606 [Rubroshorea leprosula]|uniref:Uncharacterized protein n=1 Tax=Rubroshorea leprosula TaxID=152421 RepID=A0AAV5MUD2_9ROSI|nr:hypothetical protein SLEP1_g59606 [Rubroshorea leprosula]
MDLWQRAQGLPDPTPSAALLLVSRDCCRLIGLSLRHARAWRNFFKGR